VLDTCFESYEYKLEELEQKDLKVLKKRRDMLAGMKRNIERDLQEAARDKDDKLRERERIHTDNNSFLEKREHSHYRMRCDELRKELDELRAIYKANQMYAKENASDCAIGCDKEYDMFMKMTEESFKEAKTRYDETIE